MTLSESFALCSGRVQGREHRRLLRDGQDGLAIHAAPVGLGVAVTDGCGSARASEVGARLGASWLAAHGPALVADEEEGGQLAADRLVAGLLTFLDEVAARLSPERERDAETVASMFLFSFVCAVVTPTRVLVLAQGDGVAEYNGEVSRVLPREGNAPDYVGYALLGLPHEGPRVLFDRPTSELRSLLVGTDGVFPLLDDQHGLADLRSGALGSTNPSWLEKRLRVLAKDGPLDDDAAVVVLGRRTP